MKSAAYVEKPFVPDARTYKCPACERRTILIGRVPEGMVVRRKCDCKTRGERTMVEVTARGARVVAAGEPEPSGMVEFRCEFCKRLLCKYVPAEGGAISVKCWRNSRCMRVNTLTCLCGEGTEGVG